MTCEVKIIEDTINPYNKIRLTTFQLRYWRGIHAELMTHRVFSRNASSSRAIPINTFLKQVWNDPAGPIHWGANQAGMKAHTELTGFKKWFAKKTWSLTGKLVCCIVWVVNKVTKPHKQTFNRMLEPWQYISVIVTATEYENFFALRDHPDAQPEIRELAAIMHKELKATTGIKTMYHLPYIKYTHPPSAHKIEELMKVSAARCARVSYLTHDGKTPSYENDIKLFNSLVGAMPIHASPTEHQAVALRSPKFCKNFRGWRQFRCTVEENIEKGALNGKY